MAAELCGAKLLAPIFGSSLYVWASVMGITLAALAAGYFYGGKISSTSKDRTKTLFNILLLASCFLLLMPLLDNYLLASIARMAFMPAVIISTVLILFPPIFLLGAASPLFISLQTKESSDSGKVSGTIYAVSTAGGIIATFLCGFYLIPGFGLTITLFSFGSLLFITGIFVLKIFKPAPTLIILGLMCFDIKLYAIPSGAIYQKDGLMGKVEVFDVVRNGRNIRLLTVNKIIQSEMDLQTKESVSEYINLLSQHVIGERETKKALVLGVGGGLTSNMLVKKGFEVTGVELDKRIIVAARMYFDYDKKTCPIVGDARYVVNTMKEKYDVVLFDVFKAEEQPDHVLTMESLATLKEHLSADAQVFVNWHGYLKGEIGKGTSVLYNTLKNSGFKVIISTYSDKEDERNLLFTAFNDQHISILHKEENGVVSDEAVSDLVKELYPTDEVNTDDRPILQKYNALANKRWRKSYISYYFGAQ
jgi:spermidine synthase